METMAIESIAAEYAKFHGYLTETRVPFKFDKGHSDFDVLGYNPETNHTLVIECKATGKAEGYPKTQVDVEEAFNQIGKQWEIFKKSPTNRWKLATLDEAWLIAPIKNEDIVEIKGTFGFDAKIIPIHKLLIEILVKVKADKDIRRKRYQNAALEYCRWLLRAMEANKLSLSYLEAILNAGKSDAPAPAQEQSEDGGRYADLRRQYFRAALKLVRANAGDAKTREHTIRALLALNGSGTVSDIVKQAQAMGFEMNNSRVNHGLSTWKELGIVQEHSDGARITESFVEIIRAVLDEPERDYADEDE